MKVITNVQHSEDKIKVIFSKRRETLAEHTFTAQAPAYAMVNKCKELFPNYEIDGPRLFGQLLFAKQ